MIDSDFKSTRQCFGSSPCLLGFSNPNKANRSFAACKSSISMYAMNAANYFKILQDRLTRSVTDCASYSENILNLKMCLLLNVSQWDGIVACLV